MTGFILKPFRDRVEVASDGAVYRTDGTVIGTQCKARLSDCLPLAVLGSGPVWLIDQLSDLIFRAARATQSVDETLRLIEGTLLKVGATSGFDTAVRMAIGTISETRGPTTFVFSTFEEEGGPAPLQLHEMPTGFGQGELPSGEDMLAMGLTGRSLEADAPHLFEFMRRRKRVNPTRPSAPPIFSIGGHLDLTVIRLEGYEQRVLKQWPDVIGEKIDPFKEEPAAA